MEDKKVTEEALNEVQETADSLAAEPESAEEIMETADEVQEAAEEKAEEVPSESAAAEEIAVEAEETQTDLLAAQGAVEEEEIAEEKAEEAAVDAAAELAEVQGSAEEIPELPIIKEKKKLNKTSVIAIIVAAVVVVACLVFVAFQSGWIKVPKKAKQKVEDYGTIEVLKSVAEIPDEIVQQYITNILNSQSTTNQIKEGVVADGDQLNIDFVGKLVSTGEVFEGGSATDQFLTIGSKKMIDGFESGLIGAKIGSTVTINVTFPKEYPNNEALAGQAATFDVTINYKNETVVPELTDAFVADYSQNYLDKSLSTVAELEAYVKDYLYHYYLHTAMFDELSKKQTVESYDEEKEAMLVKYSKDALDYYAAMYGTTADQYAQMAGAESADAYTLEEAHQYLKSIMLIDKIIADKNITWTDEELDQSIALYMARNGYSERYTVEEFKEASGETWMYLYTNLEFKFNLAMTALEDHVVFVDEKSTPDVTEGDTQAETAGAQTTPETESAAAN